MKDSAKNAETETLRVRVAEQDEVIAELVAAFELRPCPENDRWAKTCVTSAGNSRASRNHNEMPKTAAYLKESGSK